VRRRSNAWWLRRRQRSGVKMLQHRVLVLIPPPQEVPAGDVAWRRVTEAHGWVPNPRRQDVERSRVKRHSVHNSDSDSDYEPPRVVKTIIRDSGNTQWPVLTKSNYAEWSSMM
jgi:hypothetical protein